MKSESKKSPVELMSPAGDWRSLYAAAQGGCDAIYFGVRGLNMRAGAKNFRLNEVGKIMDYCRSQKIKGYLTLNTIIYNKEAALLDKVIAEAAKAGVDGVIGWDFAVAAASQKHGLPFCVSTQMSVSNTAALLALRQSTKAKRFVLARECSLADIKNIRKKLNQSPAKEVELEVFIHGAMCVSVSGRCFLSHDAFGKSANRGECAQPCRRQFQIRSLQNNCEWTAESDHLISPKDLCGIHVLPKLIQSGVYSFKIEGRNRGPEYVHTVTSVYREAIDWCLARKKGYDTQVQEWIKRLDAVYNRGFSDGFYLGKPASQWAASQGNEATHKKCYVGYVLKYYAKASVALIKIEADSIRSGDDLHVEGTSTGYHTFKAKEIRCNEQVIEEGVKGNEVTVPSTHKLRSKDRIYVMRPADKRKNRWVNKK